MNNDTPQPADAKKAGAKRRGVVLVAVLIVVASLSLAGYHYIDLMSTEDKGAVYSHRYAQAKACAESGIHWTAAMLANSDNYNNVLGGNPWNNAQAFPTEGTEVALDGDIKGYFRIMSPPGLDDGLDLHTPISGVTCEMGKINPNAMMKQDPTGQILHDMLLKLPNMTEDVANNIVAWMGGSVGIQNGGQTSYPNYRVKNGPLDSIDELLLVQGVTPESLYGWDLNRNGFMDGKEVDNGLGRGWAAYLTVHSREQNVDAMGNPLVNLTETDVPTLVDNLTQAGIDENLVKYIIMARQYGTTTNATGKSQSTGSSLAALLGLGGGGNNQNTTTVEGDLGSYQLNLTKAASGKPPASHFELLDTYVTISKIDNSNPMKPKTVKTVYACPLNDRTKLADMMAVLYNKTTLVADPEIAARININTASIAVLSALPGLDEQDMQKITAARPKLTAGENMTTNLGSPAWLVTDAQLDIKKVIDLEKYITTRSQVYRVQSVGSVGSKGPTVRLEAVIDTNAGRPRILAWRDLTELGKGLP